MFDSIHIKALYKISAVKRLGNYFNFMVEFYAKVSKMSQIMHICEFFGEQPVKIFKIFENLKLFFKIFELF